MANGNDDKDTLAIYYSGRGLMEAETLALWAAILRYFERVCDRSTEWAAEETMRFYHIIGSYAKPKTLGL